MAKEKADLREVGFVEKYIFQKRENGHIQLNFWLNHSKVLGTGYLNVLRDWLIAAVI